MPQMQEWKMLQLWRDDCPVAVKELFYHLQTGIKDLMREALSRVLAAFPGKRGQLRLPRHRRFRGGLLSHKAPAAALSLSHHLSISTSVQMRFRTRHLRNNLVA